MACLECRRRRIRCNGVKPVCNHCNRLSKKCEYAAQEERRGPKKRSVKHLEDRLAVLEAQISLQNTTTSTSSDAASADTGLVLHDVYNIDTLGDVANGEVCPSSYDLGFETINQDFRFEISPQEWPDTTNATIDLSSLQNKTQRIDDYPTLDEVRELNQIFFEDVYPCAPFIHPCKHDPEFLHAMKEQPPLGLRYIMWAQAAARSAAYMSRALSFYRSARMHLDHDEMQGSGQGFLTVAHVQAWALVAAYEAENAIGLRAFMSSRRAIGLANMLDLHKLDNPQVENGKSLGILPIPKDAIEAEERRRTFWYLFYGDRWVGAGPGRTFSINEDNISTLLPSSEQSFLTNTYGLNQSLPDAHKQGLAEDACPLAAAILTARLLEQCADHLRHSPEPNDGLAKEAFWMRHHQLDNRIAQALLNLPDNLRAERTNDSLALWMNMCLHLYTINIFQGAALIAEQSGDTQEIQRFTIRSRRSANEIVDIARAASCRGVRKFYPHAAFALYAACTVFVRDLEQNYDIIRAAENICFTAELIKKCRKYWSSAQVAVAQVSQLVLSLQEKGFYLDLKIDAGDTDQIGIWANQQDDMENLGPLFAKKILLSDNMQTASPSSNLFPS